MSVQKYETEYAAQSVFVVISDNSEVDNLKQEVAQPNAKVVQPEAETGIENRFSKLESNIEGIKQLLFENFNILTPNQQKKSKEKAALETYITFEK